MQISEDQVEKYITIYVEQYGKTIDKARARNELTALVCMLNAVNRHIINNDKNKNICKK
jgi:hypothetical protein